MIFDAELDKEADAVAKTYLTEARKEAIKKELIGLVDDEYYYLETEAANFILNTAVDHSNKFLRRVMQGDGMAAKELLGQKYGCDRYVRGGYNEGEPWAKLIHGKLHEPDGVKLRREIVEAFPDLLKDERVLDLESVVDGLTRQLRKAEAEIERLRGELY
jgi:hypothetical protein